MSYPLALELEYQRKLQALAREMNHLVEAEIIPFVRGTGGRYDGAIRLDADLSDLSSTIGGFYGTLRDQLIRVRGLLAERQQAAEDYIPRLIGNVTMFSRRQLERWISRQFSKRGRPALKITLPVREPPAVVDIFVAENVALIRSIVDQQLGRIHQTVLAAYNQGLSTDLIVERIRNLYGLTLNRAKLIARDQVGKITGQLAQANQQMVGIKEYRWHTVEDERVRPGHRALDGKKINWDDPPDTGQGNHNHPGNDFQCRCFAVPVVAGISDLIQNGLDADFDFSQYDFKQRAAA